MPISVFISYAHADEGLKNELVKHLAQLRNEGVITTWDDRDINAGTEWDTSIREELESAGVILLLISADFMASKYIRSVELQRAIERHEAGAARVIPVILRDCDWETAPFAKLQIAPKNAKAVTLWDDRDEAFKDVVRQIRRAVSDDPEPSPAEISNLPPQNPNFTGRENLLDRLRESLIADRTAAVVPLSGLGGVGKTQLAIEYAYRHAEDYDLVWWIRSEQTTTAASDLAALAHPLRLAERNLPDQTAIVEAVKRTLRGRSRWLLIFDNAEKPEDVAPYLPGGRTGHVIITSRDVAWGKVGKTIPVDVMSRAESIRFLLERTRNTDRDAANAVADALGDLPLALEQAGAYMESTGESLRSYLALFNDQRRDLWKAEAEITPERTVATTWQMSIDKVAASNPAAVDLLKFYAYLAPENIPRALLDDVPAELVTEALAEIGNKLKRNAAISALLQYSLISVKGETCSVHRLVQYVVRDAMTPEEDRAWAERVLEIVWRLLPPLQDSSRWPLYDVLMPHAAHVADVALKLALQSDRVCICLNDFGLYLQVRGDYVESIRTFRLAEREWTRRHGAGHERIGLLKVNLAGVLAQIGDVDTALEELAAALTIYQTIYGGRHITVVQTLGTVGYCLSQKEDHENAVRALREAEQIDRELGEPEEDEYLRAGRLNNLGNALIGLRQIDEARQYMERSLELKEKLFGSENAELVAVLNNLGAVAYRMGDLHAAERYIARSVAIAQQTYGDHPQTGRSQIGYACLCAVTGDLKKATALADKAIAGFQRALGPKNAEIASRVENFSDALRNAGHTALADEYARRAADLRP